VLFRVLTSATALVLLSALPPSVKFVGSDLAFAKGGGGGGGGAGGGSSGGHDGGGSGGHGGGGAGGGSSGGAGGPGGAGTTCVDADGKTTFLSAGMQGFSGSDGRSGFNGVSGSDGRAGRVTVHVVDRR